MVVIHEPSTGALAAAQAGGMILTSMLSRAFFCLAAGCLPGDQPLLKEAGSIQRSMRLWNKALTSQ